MIKNLDDLVDHSDIAEDDDKTDNLFSKSVFN